MIFRTPDQDVAAVSEVFLFLRPHELVKLVRNYQGLAGGAECNTHLVGVRPVPNLLFPWAGGWVGGMS